MASKEQIIDQEAYLFSEMRRARLAIFNTLTSEADETAHDGLRIVVKKDQKWGIKLAGVKFEAARLIIHLRESEQDESQTVVIVATLVPDWNPSGLPDAKIKIKVVYGEERGRETVKATLCTSNQKHLGKKHREKRKEWLREAKETLTKKFEEPERALKLLQLAKNGISQGDRG